MKDLVTPQAARPLAKRFRFWLITSLTMLAALGVWTWWILRPPIVVRIDRYTTNADGLLCAVFVAHNRSLSAIHHVETMYRGHADRGWMDTSRTIYCYMAGRFPPSIPSGETIHLGEVALADLTGPFQAGVRVPSHQNAFAIWWSDKMREWIGRLPDDPGYEFYWSEPIRP